MNGTNQKFYRHKGVRKRDESSSPFLPFFSFLLTECPMEGKAPVLQRPPQGKEVFQFIFHQAEATQLLYHDISNPTYREAHPFLWVHNVFSRKRTQKASGSFFFVLCHHRKTAERSPLGSKFNYCSFPPFISPFTLCSWN